MLRLASLILDPIIIPLSNETYAAQNLPGGELWPVRNTQEFPQRWLDQAQDHLVQTQDHLIINNNKNFSSFQI